MSNWQQSQQWGGAPHAPFGQPQQGQGWGQQQQQGGMGGWQQNAPQGQGYFNPHHQHQQPQQFPAAVQQHSHHHHMTSFPPGQVGGAGGSGFMAAGPASGFPMNQGMAMGQGQFSGGFSQQHQHHQQQFQAMQQRQQQQQMAYIQEQQRLAKEEQKKRDLEIQKRKLMNINVANPTASSSLSFDDLVSVKTSSQSSSPKVTRQTQEIAAPKSTAPVSTSKGDDPLPTHSTPLSSTGSSQLMQTASTVLSGEQKASIPAAKQPDNTFEKLMESSLSNLRDTSPSRSRKMDFKNSSKSGAKPSPLTSAQQKTTFSQSMRARAWTADGGDFSGVFSQHATQLEQQQQQLNMQQATDLLGGGGGDDSFGEFQSVGAGGGSGAAIVTPLVEPLGPLQGTTGTQGSLVDLQPVQPAFQGQFPRVGGGSAGVVGVSTQEQPRLRAATIHGGNTVPTSAYQHPISSTVVAERPLSPTGGTQFSSLDPGRFPPVYTEVLKRCSKPGEPFLDTELLFPLLMSSQLPKNVLRDLWSVANRKVLGKLNQTELFVLLGLIGLAQSGNPSPTPEDLKKAAQLPIPKLSALQETLPSVPSQMPSSTQSHTHATPTDDFGDFQQGHQSLQPSFPPPPSSSSSRSLPQAKEPVGLINVSSSTSSTAQPQGKTPAGGGDKYSVFDNLRSIGGSSEATSMPLFDAMKSSKSSEPTPQFPLATTTVAPPSAAAMLPPPQPSDGGFADFASFQQAPSSAASGLGPSAPAVVPEVVDSSSADRGWAAFGDFTSSQATTLSSSPASFPPPPPPSSSSTIILPVPSSSSVAAKSKAESAFDSLLPPELLPSKVPLKSAESETKSVEATLLGSFESKPSSVSTTTSTSAGLDFGLFESDISPESGKKKAQKQLTGLEVLEEEFSARVSAKVASSVTPPLNIDQPLVPEAAPLDDFGDFEGYSSPKEKTATGLPPLAGVSTGEPSPSLKKKNSTDPIRVWSSCLVKCSEVLESCVSVFSEVKEQTVLEEIAQSEEGRNKLKGIVEVYRLAKRVYRSFREKREGAEGETCVQSIQKAWKKLISLLPNNIMTQLYAETTPACLQEEDVLSDSISKCSLCLSSKSVAIPPHLSLDGRKEEYTSPLLFHSGQSYHSTCANFWLNVVQEELPMLV